MKDVPKAQETLNLNDLLTDVEGNTLSDYLSLSLCRNGNDMRISVSTTDVEPTVYSTVFSGVNESDLQTLLAHLQADSGSA